MSSLTERQAQRSAWRQQRQNREASILIESITHLDSIIFVGLGNWLEGALIMKRFPCARYMAIEPIARFSREAKTKRRFPGRIVTGAAWNENGQTLKMEDRREKTSAFRPSTEPNGKHTFTAATHRLDDLFLKETSGVTLLWLDCEGAEPEALSGAPELLKRARYVIIELAGQRYSMAVEILTRNGFRQTRRIKCNHTFERSEMKGIQ